MRHGDTLAMSQLRCASSIGLKPREGEVDVQFMNDRFKSNDCKQSRGKGSRRDGSQNDQLQSAEDRLARAVGQFGLCHDASERLVMNLVGLEKGLFGGCKSNQRGSTSCCNDLGMSYGPLTDAHRHPTFDPGGLIATAGFFRAAAISAKPPSCLSLSTIRN